jgi:hypothetical protein
MEKQKAPQKPSQALKEAVSKELAEKKKDQELLMDFLGMDHTQVKKMMELINGFLDIIRGVKDIRGRLSPLMEPTGVSIETSARLTSSQAHAVGHMYLMEDMFDFYQPMKGVGDQVCLPSISIDGMGREEAIRLMSAYGGGELIKQLGGINVTTGGGSGTTDLQRKKAERKGWFR